MDILNSLILALVSHSVPPIFSSVLWGFDWTLIASSPGSDPSPPSLLLPLPSEWNCKLHHLTCGSFLRRAVWRVHDLHLVNIPGEAASVITCLDGYKMRGKAVQVLHSGWPPLVLYRWTFSVIGLMLWHLGLPGCHEVWTSGAFV